MANITADKPGTTVQCPTCYQTVDPYYHCCIFASDDDVVPQVGRREETRWRRFVRWLKG